MEGVWRARWGVRYNGHMQTIPPAFRLARSLGVALLLLVQARDNATAGQPQASPGFAEIALTPSDTTITFGQSIASSDGTVVVGDSGPVGNGTVSVFLRPHGGWTGAASESAILVASDGGFDAFGFSVAVSGGTIVVGAPFQTIGGTREQGAAYVFTRPRHGWRGVVHEAAKLIHSDGTQFDWFGFSMAVSGDTVVVGSPFYGSNGHGAAFVFERPPKGWRGTLTESARLVASDAEPQEHLGDAVGVSGDTVAVGAILANVGPNMAQGAVYVFGRPGGGWRGEVTETAQLVASDGTFFDLLGGSVAIHGDTVIAGALNDDVGPKIDQGSAYVFVRPRGGWASTTTEVAKLVASDGNFYDQFGISVAINRDFIVVGSYKADAVTTDQGAAYVFERSKAGGTSSVLEVAKLTASQPEFHDSFGYAVGLDGSTPAVTSFGEAYVFTPLKASPSSPR